MDKEWFLDDVESGSYNKKARMMTNKDGFKWTVPVKTGPLPRWALPAASEFLAASRVTVDSCWLLVDMLNLWVQSLHLFNRVSWSTVVSSCSPCCIDVGLDMYASGPAICSDMILNILILIHTHACSIILKQFSRMLTNNERHGEHERAHCFFHLFYHNYMRNSPKFPLTSSCVQLYKSPLNIIKSYCKSPFYPMYWGVKLSSFKSHCITLITPFSPITTIKLHENLLRIHNWLVVWNMVFHSVGKSPTP